MNTKDVIESIKKMAADSEQLELLRTKRSAIVSAINSIESQIKRIKDELGIYEEMQGKVHIGRRSSGDYDKYYIPLLEQMAKGEGIRPADAGTGFDLDVNEKARVISAIYAKLQKDDRIEKQGKVYYMKELAKALYTSPKKEEVKPQPSLGLVMPQ